MNNTLIKIFFFCLALGHGISKAQYITEGDPFCFCALNGSCYNQVPGRLVTMIDTDFTLEQAVFNTEAFIIATIVDDNNYPLCSRHSSIVLDEDTVISKIGDSPLVKHSNPGSIRASILLPRAISPITAEGPTPIRW